MTDRELLELAAKAAGIRVDSGGEFYEDWNPLADDGDAFRLAVKLEMQVSIGFRRIDASICWLNGLRCGLNDITITCLRVETGMTVSANIDMIRELFGQDWRDVACLKFLRLKDSMTRPAATSKGLHKRRMGFFLRRGPGHQWVRGRLALPAGGLLAKQKPGSENVKAVSATLAVDDLRNPIQSLCVPVADWVVKVSQHLNTPVPGGCQKRAKALLPLFHPGWNRCSPGIKPLGGFSLIGGIVDFKEGLFHSVSNPYLWFIVQPHLKVESALFVQVLVTHPEKCFAPHPVCSNLFLLAFSESNANVIHGLVCHLDQVELVNDHWQAWEYCLSGILIRLPHVNRQSLDGAPVLELVQPGGYERLISVWKHVNRNPIDHIGQDASQLSVNLSLINAKPLWEIGLELLVKHDDVLPSKGPNSLVVAANMLSNAYKGVSQALGLDELNTSLGHAHVRLDTLQRLKECLPAVTALVTLDTGKDIDRSTTNRAVAVGDGLGAMLVRLTNNAAFRAVGRLDGVLSFNHIFVVVTAFYDGFPAREVKYVGHSPIVMDIRGADFGSDFHPKLAQHIGSIFGWTPSPVIIAPRVLDKLSVTSCVEFATDIFVLISLSPQDVAHDFDLHAIPIRAPPVFETLRNLECFMCGWCTPYLLCNRTFTAPCVWMTVEFFPVIGMLTSVEVESLPFESKRAEVRQYIKVLLIEADAAIAV